MQSAPSSGASGLMAVAAAYKAQQQKMKALETEQLALLQEAMRLLQESRMSEARKKLEAILQ